MAPSPSHSELLLIDTRYQKDPKQFGEVVDVLGPWVWVRPTDDTTKERALKDAKGVTTAAELERHHVRH